MGEIIDRVAKAIAECHGRDWSRMSEAGGKEWWREEASAAIEAMREPTKAMVEAHDDYPFMPEAMGRMIDAALKS